MRPLCAEPAAGADFRQNFRVWPYRFYFKHVWSWDLFAVAVTFVGVKLTVLTWFWLTD
jgi:hypothetical protein